jgi:hypothetical protein
VADEDRPGQVPEEEELIEQLQEELKKLKISDVLLQTVFTVSSLGYRSLGEEDRDLGQARLAIEALKALVPVLKGTVPDQVTHDFETLVANMQLSYATAASKG